MFWEALPNLIATGMRADEFWHGDMRLARSYRAAFRLKQEREYVAEWRSGLYVVEALLTAAPAFREFSEGVRHTYPDMPLQSALLDEDDVQEIRDRHDYERNRGNFMAQVTAANRRLAEQRQQEGQTV